MINTMPEQTLRAFADHGQARAPSTPPHGGRAPSRDADGRGLDLDAVTAKLEREGVQSFCDSYRELLDCIEGKLAVVGAPGG